ncbi:MAG: hypothetical protein ACO294_08205 [Methylococcales bacterium]
MSYAIKLGIARRTKPIMMGSYFATPAVPSPMLLAGASSFSI